MNNCIFCKIVRKEISCNLVYEDKDFFAFLDIRPVNPGHTLVIPKKHYRWVWDVDDFGKYLETTKKIEKAVSKALKTEWVVMSVAGNEIPHAHIHLIPRFENDGHGGFVKPENIKDISKEEMNKVLENIKKNI